MLKAILLIYSILFCFTPTSAKQRYFYQRYFNSKLQYELRYEITTSDTALAKCFRCTFDEQDRLTRIEHISAGHLREVSNSPIARVDIQYGKDWERYSYYNQNGRRQADEDGEFGMKFVHDTLRTYFGPLVIPCGMMYLYDKDDSLLESNWRGCSRYRVYRDKYGYINAKYCLNSKYEGISDRDKTYFYTYQYDNVHNEVVAEAHNSESEVVAKNIMSYDSLKNRTRIEHYRNGKLLHNAVAIQTNKYDKHGFITEHIEFDEDSSLIRKIEFITDQYGNCTSKRIYDGDGKLLVKGGIITYEYDKENKLILSAVRSPNGALLWFAYYGYDENGEENMIQYLDSLQKPLIGPYGYSSYKSFYDRQNDRSITEYYDKSGNLTNFGKDSIARVLAKFDNDHQLIEVRFLNKDGNPTYNSDYRAATVIITRKNSEEIWTRFGSEGQEIKN